MWSFVIGHRQPSNQTSRENDFRVILFSNENDFNAQFGCNNGILALKYVGFSIWNPYYR